MKNSYSSATTKQPNSRVGKGLEQMFLQKDIQYPMYQYFICQYAHEKVLNITNHLGNANQNHNDKDNAYKK